MPGNFLFSLVGIYGKQDQEMKFIRLFLQNKDAKILGQDSEEIKGPQCDGCDTPKLDDSLSENWKPIIGFSSSIFPLPAMILDTSGTEGISRSLWTFDSEGKKQVFTDYEYTVNCH